MRLGQYALCASQGYRGLGSLYEEYEPVGAGPIARRLEYPCWMSSLSEGLGSSLHLVLIHPRSSSTGHSIQLQ